MIVYQSQNYIIQACPRLTEKVEHTTRERTGWTAGGGCPGLAATANMPNAGRLGKPVSKKGRGLPFLHSIPSRSMEGQMNKIWRDTV